MKRTLPTLPITHILKITTLLKIYTGFMIFDRKKLVTIFIYVSVDNFFAREFSLPRQRNTLNVLQYSQKKIVFFISNFAASAASFGQYFILKFRCLGSDLWSIFYFEIFLKKILMSIIFLFSFTLFQKMDYLFTQGIWQILGHPRISQGRRKG